MSIVVVHDSRCEEYCQVNHPERPQRISETVALLQKQDILPVEWRKPRDVDEKIILRAHTPEHVEKVRQKTPFDNETPGYPMILEHSVRSVGGALEAMHCALKEGKHAFSLMRPPGHHAERNRAMGFCYFNNAAICALEALATSVMRVAVFDFDVHHGNGTEAILRDTPDSLYVSVHQFPSFPGTGGSSKLNTWNYPVMPESSSLEYLNACHHAINRIRNWQPELLIVSAGFDAYKADPLGEQLLQVDDFATIGRWITGTQIPSFSVLEGGYSNELPHCILAYLSGLNKK